MSPLLFCSFSINLSLSTNGHHNRVLIKGAFYGSVEENCSLSRSLACDTAIISDQMKTAMSSTHSVQGQSVRQCCSLVWITEREWMIERMQHILPEPTLYPGSRQSEAIKQRGIELETVKNIPCSGCQEFNLFFFLLPQWEMMTTSWAWASSRRPSPQTRRSPYLTSCMNLRKGTLSRTSQPISTAKQRLPHRFTSSATASGSIRRTTLWRRRWTKTQVSEAHQLLAGCQHS